MYTAETVRAVLRRIVDTQWVLATRVHRSTRGEPLDFERWPFLEALYRDNTRDIAIMTGTQSGKTEFLILRKFALCAHGAAVFYVLPKDELKNVFVTNRVDRPLRLPAYRQLFMAAAGADNKGLKALGRGTCRYVGSGSLSAFKEYPADAVIVDELDECDSVFLEYANDRLGASDLKHTVLSGNPTVAGAGIARWVCDESDWKEWFVPCDSCELWQHITWYDHVVRERRDGRGALLTVERRDEAWDGDPERDLLPICSRCGSPVNRLGRGEWRARFPGRPVSGWQLGKLPTPTNRLSDLYRRYERLRRSLTGLQAFTNSDLGLPFEHGEAMLTAELLDRCVEPEYELPSGQTEYGPCTMGVDVGAFLDVRVSDYPPGRRRLVFAGKLSSDDELFALIARYRVTTMVVDALPEVKRVRDWVNRLWHAVSVWRCEFAGAEGTYLRDTHVDEEERLLRVDRTALLDDAFSDIVNRVAWLPSAWRDLAFGEYEEEMTGPKRLLLTNPQSGKQRWVWSKCKDHQRLADSYDCLASQLRRSFDPMRGLPAPLPREELFDPFAGLKPATRVTHR